MVFAFSIPSCCRIDSKYFVWVIFTEFFSCVISMPTILVGSPISMSLSIHLRSFFFHVIASSVSKNNRRSSTHTVIMDKLSLSHCT